MPLNARFTLTQEIGVGAMVSNWWWWMTRMMSPVFGTRSRHRLYPGQSARVHSSWKQVRVDFGVENLFDTFYSLPTGRLYRAGRPCSSTVFHGGSLFPGMGRSFYAGVNVSF